MIQYVHVWRARVHMRVRVRVRVCACVCLYGSRCYCHCRSPVVVDPGANGRIGCCRGTRARVPSDPPAPLLCAPACLRTPALPGACTAYSKYSHASHPTT